MSLDTAKAVTAIRGLTVKFDAALMAAEQFYPRICTEVDSTGADEQYGGLGGMPGMREWLGDRQFKGLRGGHFTIDNRDWESSLLVSKNDIADDRMKLYPALMADLATEAAAHPDELVLAELLPAANATAGFDGQFFYDTDHVWGDSGTIDNDLVSDVVDSAVVTAAEFRTSYHQARAALMSFRNDQGKLLNRPMMRKQSNMLIMVPPALHLAAVTGLTAALTGGGDTNVVLDLPEIMVCPYLTSTVEWYLFNLGGALKPFVFQKREPLTRGSKGIDDLETKDIKFMTQARYAAGYLAWWTTIMTTFVT